MPRKTLALILGLVLVTIILFIIALRTGQQGTGDSMKNGVVKASPTPVAHSVLTLSPNPVAVASGKQGQVEVMIDTSINKVTSVELELKYDPLVVSNVKLSLGPLFPNALVLKDNNNVKTGKYIYAFGIYPNQKAITGTGSVATITFTARGAVGRQSQILIEPTSLVAAVGVSPSVLKSATGTTVVIGSATTTDVMENVTPTNPPPTVPVQ